MDLYKNFPNASANFDPKYKPLLNRLVLHSISTVELLNLAPTEIAKKIDKPVSDVFSLLKSLSDEIEEELSKSFQSSSDSTTDIEASTVPAVPKVSPVQKICLQDEMIDSYLGGIPTHNITEITGESSSAKTQFLLALSVKAQLPKSNGGLNKKVVYMHTESFLETKRLQDIIEQTDFPGISTDNIFQISMMDWESQEHILHVQLPILLQREDVGLVVIDSVSHHLRVEFQKYHTRQRKVLQMGVFLKWIAREFGVAVVVSNQVTDIFSSETRSDGNTINDIDMTYDSMMTWWNGNLNVIPVLGLYWSNFVDIRITVEKLYDDEENGRLRRFMKLVYHPYENDRNENLEFEVYKGGIRGI